MFAKPVMRIVASGLSLVIVLGGWVPAVAQDELNEPLFEGLGSHHREVTTSSPLAQRYFDQGLNWYYAFNHDEAIKSFRKAAELDPKCAMAWWGVSLSEGPNYNDPEMTEERSAGAWDGLQKALARMENTTTVERALIEALSHRYAKPWPEDRKALNQAYADAMAKVWSAYPNDSDVGTLYAESMMVQRPWELYSLDHKPAPDTPKILAALERVMEMDPQNPGANHLYIHTVELSESPDRGLVAADRLCDMVPGSGHLEHMPSHIYVQVGKWNEAIIQNAKAERADAKYRALSPEQRIQHLYMVHNSHMLAFAAMMSGREREALEAARAMWKNVPEDALHEVAPLLDPWLCCIYDVQKRFGRWDAIIAEEAPPEFLPITTAIWRAHRAIAYAAKKDFENAELEQKAFHEALTAMPEDLMWFTDPAREILAVSDKFVAGEIALHRGDLLRAAEELEAGARLEDALTYSEPPQWTQPVRHTLGAVYLASGRNEDAERVYREDLAKWRNNGWSLYGLSRALQKQGKTKEAAEVERQYRAAWKRADAPTKTSCKCVPET
jgi:tetratricopeptide (TPR) repeat protein